MAWDNADEIFPGGYAYLPDGNVLTNEELKKSPYKTIFRHNIKKAIDMIVRQNTYFWGDEGEFRIIPTYDVYAQTPHANDNCYPLNVYGQQMVNDFLALNNIKLKK